MNWVKKKYLYKIAHGNKGCDNWDENLLKSYLLFAFQRPKTIKSVIFGNFLRSWTACILGL